MLKYIRHGHGPVLVLQHGFLGGGTVWMPQIAFFSRFFDVIAPDLPGFAGSGHLPPADSIDGMAASVMDLLESLSVARFCFVGHSMGGMVAQQIAAGHGGRVEKLVLYGTACTGEMPARHESFAETARTMEKDGLEATGARIAATWFMDGALAPYYAFCRAAGAGTTLEAALAALVVTPAWDGTAALAGLGMPTLVVGGDHDRSFSLEEMANLARTIPDAQLGLLPGCAHNAHLEKPDLFNQILADFLLSGGRGQG